MDTLNIIGIILAILGTGVAFGLGTYLLINSKQVNHQIRRTYKFEINDYVTTKSFNTKQGQALSPKHFLIDSGITDLNSDSIYGTRKVQI